MHTVLFKLFSKLLTIKAYKAVLSFNICPVVKHAWTTKGASNKDVYYYVYRKDRTARGKSCDNKAMFNKTDMEPIVIETIWNLFRMRIL